MWSDNESSTDLLGCQHLVDVVTSIIKNEDLLPATIGVFGDWGSGKSSLLQMVKTNLEASSQEDQDYLVLTFNGWTFEGYEDARTALMSTILDEVASQRTLTAKGKELAVKLLKRINWMRVLGAGAKSAIAFGIGGPVGLGLSAGTDLAAKATDLLKKGQELGEEEFKKFLNEDQAQEARRDIREFRKDFEKFVDSANLKALVVIIDDLDRCMPDTIIETLEAIKLFLYAHKTAFVLGADERLVKYAVRKRFPELPGERVEVGRDYLEKLVQYPIRVLPLGRTEIETYINLLFAKSEMTPEQFEVARTKATTCDASTLLDVRFNHGIAESILNRPLPPALAENLVLARRIAPFLANTSGYPRQCKRFLNMLVMRLAMARSRGVTLQQRILAKLMLLEYFRPASFRKLAELQAAEQGRAAELLQAESALRPSPELTEVAEAPEDQSEGRAKGRGKKQAATPPLKEPDLPGWLSESWTREWLTSDPQLSDVDLRPYFYFSRDTLGQLGVMSPRLSPLAQQLLVELFDKSAALRLNALKKAKDLNPDESVAVFDALCVKAREEEDQSDERSAMQRCLDWAKHRPEHRLPLFSFLSEFPVGLIPVNVPMKILGLRDSDDEKRHAKLLADRWAQQNDNPKLKSVVNSRLEQFTV
jgi:KAP family P-loop domain